MSIDLLLGKQIACCKCTCQYAASVWICCLDYNTPISTIHEHLGYTHKSSPKLQFWKKPDFILMVCTTPISTQESVFLHRERHIDYCAKDYYYWLILPNRAIHNNPWRKDLDFIFIVIAIFPSCMQQTQNFKYEMLFLSTTFMSFGDTICQIWGSSWCVAKKTENQTWR
jgi:hypothetical protein